MYGALVPEPRMGIVGTLLNSQTKEILDRLLDLQAEVQKGSQEIVKAIEGSSFLRKHTLYESTVAIEAAPLPPAAGTMEILFL